MFELQEIAVVVHSDKGISHSVKVIEIEWNEELSLEATPPVSEQLIHTFRRSKSSEACVLK